MTNVLLSGVGGQGTITASNVLAQAALVAGWDVKKSEIHGMSQRGGSVESQVRISVGSDIFSPTIPAGEVDVLIGFELLEALRAMPQTRPEATIVVDPRRIVPLTVSMGVADYPDDGLDRLQASGRRVVVVHASDEAAALGELRAANIVLLGAAAAVLPLPREAFQEAIRRSVKPKAVDVNLAAFERGVELAEGIGG